MTTRLRRFPQPTPPPLSLLEKIKDEDVRDVVKDVLTYQHAQSVNTKQRENLLVSNFILNEEQVPSFSAEKITAGDIGVDDIYLGDSSGTEKFHFDGLLKRIVYTDSGGVERVRLGNLAGDGAGLQIKNASGDTILDVDGLGTDVVGSLQIENGALDDPDYFANNVITQNLIANNAITAPKINVSNLAAISADFGTITAGTINATVSINAAAIDAGTITADGSPVSIEITGSGALLLSGGGDAVFRANGTNFSFARFQNSSSSQYGEIGISGGVTSFDITATGAADLFLQVDSTSDSIRLQEDSGSNCDFVDIRADDTIVRGNIYPASDNAEDNGLSGNRWADLNSVLINGADIGFDHLMVFTEPYMIWTQQTMDTYNIDKDRSVVLVSPDGQPSSLFEETRIRFRAELPPADLDIPSVKKRKRKPHLYEFKNGKWERKIEYLEDGRVRRKSDGKILEPEEIFELNCKDNIPAWKAEKIRAMEADRGEGKPSLR